MTEQGPSSSLPVVLVVEDDRAIVEVLEDVLTAAAYHVEYAATGLAGLSRLQAGGVDLVLLDVHLPGLSGLELCRAIRAAAGAADGYVPIIMMTGLVGAAACRAGLAAGADDYILKPFDLEELLVRVAVWLQARRQMQAAHALEEGLPERARRPPPAPSAATQLAVREMADRLGSLLAGIARFFERSQRDLPRLTAPQSSWLADARRRLTAAAHTVEQLHQVALDGANAGPGAPAVCPEAASGDGSPASDPVVLLVEDDAAVSEVLTERLTRDGYTVRQAADGLEGVFALDEGLLQTNRRCVLLLDLMLPEVDGLGILAFVRGAAHRIPVVAMSASEAQLAAARAAGADALMPKPLDVDRLVEVVAQYCPPAGK